jgi:hypothetical protein
MGEMSLHCDRGSSSYRDRCNSIALTEISHPCRCGAYGAIAWPFSSAVTFVESIK